MNVPEIEKRQKMIQHITNYEYVVFYHAVTIFLNAQYDKEYKHFKEVEIELLESFILHFRVLYDFLFKNRKAQDSNGKFVNDDPTNLFATDYLSTDLFDAYFENSLIKESKKKLKDYRQRTNKYLAHLTTDRSNNEASWDVALIALHISKASLAFYEMLDENLKNDFAVIKRGCEDQIAFYTEMTNHRPNVS